MNKLKSSKVMLVLSVLLVLVLIGSVSAADEAGNETVSTSNSDVDALSQEVDSVDDEVSAAEPAGDLVVNDTSKQDEKLGASNDESILSETANFNQLKTDLSGLKSNSIISLNKDYQCPSKGKYLLTFNNLNNATINGNGHIINGKNVGTLFIIFNSCKNITVTNITFTNLYQHQYAWPSSFNKANSDHWARGVIILMSTSY